MKHVKEACEFKLKATRDTLEVIQCKWRIPIIISLQYGKKRFGEIQKDILDISPKMLSQELKALEMNKIIVRTVHDSCLLYTSPSPRDGLLSRMPSSA